jgi:hypothetical protein
MIIPQVDLRKQCTPLRGEDLNAVGHALDAVHLLRAESVQALERDCAVVWDTPRDRRQ